MNALIASFFGYLVQFILKFGSQKLKDIIAKSKAHSRIDSQVRELERVISLPDNTNKKKDMVINAARNLIHYHDAP